MCGCFSDWCRSKRLQLNVNVLRHGHQSSKNTNCKRFAIGNDAVEPVNVVRNLGVLCDENLNMKSHISNISRTCFFHLRRLRSVRQQLGRVVTERLVSAFVLSRLDYCNAMLARLPVSHWHLFSGFLMHTRLIFNLKPRDHITSALQELHWLPIRQRIEYKLCLLVYLSINDQAPSYLQQKLTFVSDLPGRRS